MLAWQRDGADPRVLMLRQLMQQVVAGLGRGLLAAFPFAAAGGWRGHVPRVASLPILGFAAFLEADAANRIWYGYPSARTFGKLLENVIGFTCIGAVVGLVGAAQREPEHAAERPG